MQNRTKALLTIRPQITTILEENVVSVAEKFQNETLRPILKFQNDLLIRVFKHYIKKRKNTFYNLIKKEKLNYIQHAASKDRAFNNLLQGIVIGHFSEEEWKVFIENEKELMRRINNLVVQRLQSQMEEF